MNNKAILNAYPDSIGGKLEDIISIFNKEEFKDVFKSFYILPSIFNTDLDRGFSLISYDLCEKYAGSKDIEKLHKLDIDLVMDFILNHISVLSKQFQDIIANGQNSKYRDFFIDWNRFWEGKGVMSEDGYIIPNKEYTDKMFFRKPGLPILMVRFPDGKEVPYWNTFYQKVIYHEIDEFKLVKKLGMQYKTALKIKEEVNTFLKTGKDIKELQLEEHKEYKEAILEYLNEERSYLGQMDLNIKSPLVWDYYKEVLKKLSDYGVSIVRLDAFAYAPKKAGEKNFLNDPGTWELLSKIDELAKPLNLTLLPEIHASYEEKIYELLSKKGYMVYDFFLPGLLIDAFERKSGEYLKKWADEIIEKKISTLNMLGCHDGIPLLDLKGLLPEEDIQNVIDAVKKRGGYVKDLHGAKNMYYQVNATYYSALGEDDKKMELARAIQLFMPGKPQVWYLDLFAGKNDYEAMRLAGPGGHKEINRSNLSLEDVEERLQMDVVKKQLELLRFRNTSKAFKEDAEISFETVGSRLIITWISDESKAVLDADFQDYRYTIKEQS